jgi:hypothetical protein
LIIENTKDKPHLKITSPKLFLPLRFPTKYYVFLSDTQNKNKTSKRLKEAVIRWYGAWRRGGLRKDTTHCGLDNRCQLFQQPFKSIVTTSQEIPGSNFGTERNYPNNIAVSFLELQNHKPQITKPQITP